MGILSNKNFTKLDQRHLSNVAPQKGDPHLNIGNTAGKNGFSNLLDALMEKARGLSKNDIVNIVILISIFLFILSLTRAIQTNQQTSDSRASEDIGRPALAEGHVPGPLYYEPVIASFPSGYKEYVHDADFYHKAVSEHNSMDRFYRSAYITNVVARYYVFHDVLSGAGIIEAQPLLPFVEMEKNIDGYEELVIDNFITHADFYHVSLKYLQNNTEGDKQAQSQLGGDPKTIAMQKIEEYRTQFQQNATNPTNIEAIFKKIATDEEVTILNGGANIYKNKENYYEESYTPNGELFPGDTKFNDFLFAQKEKTVSEVYEYANPLGEPMGFVIVIPTTIFSGTFNSIDELIQQRSQFFIYITPEPTNEAQ